MNTRKTKLMLRTEALQGQPLESLLCDRINAVGLTGCAKELGVGKATLGYWCLKLGIEVRRIALRPGETIEVKRARE